MKGNSIVIFECEKNMGSNFSIFIQSQVFSERIALQELAVNHNPWTPSALVYMKSFSWAPLELCQMGI
jgi:hypothetical protein